MEYDLIFVMFVMWLLYIMICVESRNEQVIDFDVGSCVGL